MIDILANTKMYKNKQTIIPSEIREKFDIDRPHLTINGSGFMVDNQFTVVKPKNYKRYVEEHDCFECPQKCEMCNSICSKKLGVEIVEVEK